MLLEEAVERAKSSLSPTVQVTSEEWEKLLPQLTSKAAEEGLWQRRSGNGCTGIGGKEVEIVKRG